MSEWLECVKFFECRCAFCGEVENLTRSHVVPIKYGGANDIVNVIPVCRKCVAERGDREFVEFVTSKFQDADEIIDRVVRWNA